MQLAQNGYVVIIPDYDDYVNLLPLPVSNDDQWEITLVNQWQEDWGNLTNQMAHFGYVLPANLMSGRDWLEEAMGGSLLINLEDTEANKFFVDLIFGRRQAGLEAILAAICDPQISFEGKDLIDSKKIILIGHSIGGLSSLTVASGDDYEISTLVAMAPVSGLLPVSEIHQIKVPTLWLLADGDFDWINNPAATRSSYCSGEVVIMEGATHYTFSDLGRLVEIGTDGQVSEQIQEEIIRFVLTHCPPG